MSHEIASSAEQMAHPDEITRIYRTAQALSNLAAKQRNAIFIMDEPSTPPEGLFDELPPMYPGADVSYRLEAEAVPEAIRPELVYLDLDEVEQPAVPIADVVITRHEKLTGDDTGVTRNVNVGYKVFEYPSKDPSQPNRQLLKATYVGVKAEELSRIKPEHMFSPEITSNHADTPIAVGSVEAVNLAEYMTDAGVQYVSNEPPAEA